MKFTNFLAVASLWLPGLHASNDTKQYHKRTYGQSNRSTLRQLLHHDHIPTESRIVGGSDAAAGEFPFFVEWVGCGASLIHPDILLTAAHCNPQFYSSVIVGTNIKGDLTNGIAEPRTIVDRSPHPSYNDRTVAYDYMVMKLDQPVTTITPVSLNFDDSIPSNGQTLTVIGYGATQESGSTSNRLQKVNVDFVPTNTCNSAASYAGDIQGNVMFCAGEAGKDSCQGDSGGPIFVSEADGSFTQVGVVSWGYGCARNGFPGVYSRVSGVEAWIKSQVCAMSSDPPDYCSNNDGGSTGDGGNNNGSTGGGGNNGGSTGGGGNNNGTGGGGGNNNGSGAGGGIGGDQSEAVDDTDAEVGDRVQIRFDIVYDNFPNEVSWEILRGETVIYRKPLGAVSESGLVPQRVGLVAGGEYSFKIMDTFGDGMCCGFGQGRYDIYAETPEGDIPLAEGNGIFETEDTRTFTVPILDTSNESTPAPVTAQTPAPVAAPTLETAPGAPCQDSDEFFLVDEIVGDRDCSWLSSNTDRFGYLCLFVDIAVKCKVTCDVCLLFAS